MDKAMCRIPVTAQFVVENGVVTMTEAEYLSLIHIFLQYYRPEMRPQVIEALKRAGREDLIGTGPDCLVPPQREASAGGGRRLQEPRRGKNDERRGNVKSGRENAPAGKGKTRGKRAR